jgi:putative sporulation protein YtaF
LLTILSLAISSNLDTLAVALAYGARKFRLPFVSNFICALIPCLGTYLTMLVGSTLRRFVSAQLAGILGAGIIVAAGAVLIIQFLGKSRKTGEAATESDPPYTTAFPPRPQPHFSLKELGSILKDPLRADYDYSGTIEVKEALLLALALTLNNLSAGLAAGLMGLSVLLMVGFSFVISIAFFYAGIGIGLLFIARWFGRWSDLVAGIILILLGIYEVLT